MLTSFTFIVPLVLIICFLISINSYNNLVNKFHRVEQSSKNLYQALERRNSNLASLTEHSPKYLDDHKDLLEQIKSLIKKNNELRNDPKKKLQLASDFDLVQSKLKKIMDIEKGKDQDKTHIVIQATINELEEQLAASRRSHEAAVYDYNSAIESFPSNVFARMAGYGRVEDEVDDELGEELILKDLEKTKVYEELRRDSREHKN